MNDNTNTLIVAAHIVASIGVCGAVAVACKTTRSALPLLGLVFIPTLKVSSHN